MECRTNDTETQSVLTTVNNQITYSCVMAERAFTRALGATCASPVAAFCVLEDGDLRMRAQLFSEDGSEMVEDRVVFDCDDPHTPPSSRASCWRGRPSRFGGCSPPNEAVLVLRPEPGATVTVESRPAAGPQCRRPPALRN